MPTRWTDSDVLQSELAVRAAARGVPGAAIAVVIGDEIVDAAIGVLSTATGVSATTDSVFQIGSITKVWTATLVMQLVDDGLVELDRTVRTYLPEFALADESAAAAITVRQLLSHQAGFEGDIFTDTGRGDDAVERYVATLADDAQIFPPGAFFSYNNAGYIVLGRLVERLREKTWEQAVLDHLAAPLGLERVSPSPYEAILHRAAVGHVGPGEDGVETPAPMWALARSNGPAGSMLAMTARDLAGFARMHLDDGVASDGAVVLSAASARAMRQTEVTLPTLTGMGVAWGLGWEIATDDSRAIGHDGNTIGQSSFLRLVPDSGVAVVLLTNGGDGMGLFADLGDAILRELAGVELPGALVPAADPGAVDASAFVGVYSNSLVDMTVSQEDDGRIWLEQHPKGFLVELGQQVSRHELVAFEDDSLIQREATSGMHPVFAFLAPDAEGRAAYVHYGRAIARATDEETRTTHPIAHQEETQ
ncbi:serine hydrolase domain-containing protein [Microbacterium sp. RD1]|uniref:serine hydrolase domain-containing protein n=1 Tax=Microbacterium sp. RD1 TaxID=3457313 RepID=UPI003FA55ECE